MRKYLLSILPLVAFLYLVLFFLQFPENAFAKDVYVQCTCDDPGVPDSSISNNHNNSYHCGSQGGLYTDQLTQVKWQYAGSCSHAEQACAVNTNKKQDIYTVNTIGGRGAPSNTIHYVGVTCAQPNATQKGSSINCSCVGPNDSRGNPTSIKCTNNLTNTSQTNACGGAAICVKGSGLSYNGFSNQSVSGIGCEQSCICQGTNGAQGSQSKTGNGNNGKRCYNADGTLGAVQTYCTNREDYCENDSNATDGIKCVNSTKCTCKNNYIWCTSAGSGDNNSTETYTLNCGTALCVQGAGVDDPGFKAFNQHITGIECKTSPPPPPPSPPCEQWQGGQCTTFKSALGNIATNPAGFVQSLFGILLSVSGGIALLLIIRAGYQLMTSQGKPEQLQQGRDQLIAAIVGLIFLIFSFVFLQLIGYDILRINAFGGGTSGGATAQSCNAAGLQYCSKTQQCLPASSTCP